MSPEQIVGEKVPSATGAANGASGGIGACDKTTGATGAS